MSLSFDGAVAGWCQLPSPAAAEIVGSSGVDLVCLDAQHGLLGDDSLLASLQALRGVPTLVRVPHNAPDPIARALDRGADGVIVPLVDSAVEAAAAASACAYPEAGVRSFGPTRVGWTGADVLARGRCVIMVETMAAVADLPAILLVEGVDAIFVGPSDLSLSSGRAAIPPLDDDGYRDLLRSVTAQCREAGMPVGVYCGAPDWAPTYRALGFTWLTLPSEAGLLQGAVGAALAALRS
ncbi:aldolase/citrate lyase family protein [Pseudonocardia kujensis]|uniref:HpcH/HpaI aldolase family protein n=1 Tax=Pseudonocardia kujensis TaxID=1128675 RepID=UPI001E3ADEB0|nr:aldolase/citrate lyase family protein [Pseudonocardia kujensis]MCE0762312.1 aldolase/citrate lyase family protein [Pseudonocardia kujensis]